MARNPTRGETLMSVQHQETSPEVISDPGIQSPESSEHGRGRRTVANWVLTLLTVPAAALTMIFAVGGAMSIAACSAPQCPALGQSGLVYGVLFYGAPV